MDVLTLHIDPRDAIANHYLQGLTSEDFRRPWVAFVYRRFDKVVIAQGAFLPRDESGRWVEITCVPRGAYLGFGAEIRQPDGSWVKTRTLYLVQERTHETITLLPVTELDVPACYELDAASNPLLLALQAQVEARLEHLQQQLNALAAKLDPPSMN
jgi:hypothetical protein